MFYFETKCFNRSKNAVYHQCYVMICFIGRGGGVSSWSSLGMILGEVMCVLF